VLQRPQASPAPLLLGGGAAAGEFADTPVGPLALALRSRGASPAAGQQHSPGERLLQALRLPQGAGAGEGSAWQLGAADDEDEQHAAAEALRLAEISVSAAAAAVVQAADAAVRDLLQTRGVALLALEPPPPVLLLGDGCGDFGGSDAGGALGEAATPAATGAEELLGGGGVGSDAGKRERLRPSVLPGLWSAQKRFGGHHFLGGKPASATPVPSLPLLAKPALPLSAEQSLTDLAEWPTPPGTSMSGRADDDIDVHLDLDDDEDGTMTDRI
jgi:hypothetical protein